MRVAAYFAMAAAAVMCMGVTKAQVGVTEARIQAAAPGDWLTYGRTTDEQRFSPLTQINKDTVGKLGLAWWTSFETDRGQEATPLVADGVLYTTTAWSHVAAFDAATGAEKWRYDPKVPGEKGFNACCDVVNRGVALWRNEVIVGTLDGRLIALDRETGKPVWSTRTTEFDKPYTITGAPRIAHGLVLIGNAGAEYPVRGYISAYDAATGKLAWRFYLTPGPSAQPDHAASDPIMNKVLASWGPGAWQTAGGGGAAPWDAITYDPKTDLVYLGTGNAGPWNDRIRSSKGDNLFAASIVALHAKTGAYAWHYQTTPRDAFDYDAVQQLMTADLPIGGKTRHVVMQANKNGFYYVLDAKSGKLLSAQKFVPADWADHVDMKTGRPVEVPDARYTPGGESHRGPAALGGHNWQPMSFSPRTGLVYVPAQVSGWAYADTKSFNYIPGGWNLGLGRDAIGPSAKLPVRRGSDRPPPKGVLVAWDPVAAKARWTIDLKIPWSGGTLATAGGLVFHPDANILTAYDAESGKPVWTYDLGAYAIAAPMTYSIHGEQYLALMVGYGGAGGMGGDQPRRKGRLLVFKLGANAVQAPYPERRKAIPVDYAKADPSTGNADNGGAKFGAFCGTCHGGGAFLPNLFTSPTALNQKAFQAIVYDGALSKDGMRGFKQFMTPQDVEDIRAFVLWAGKAMAAAPPVQPAVESHPQ